MWVEVAGKGQLTRASLNRGDIGNAFPALGPGHGYDLTLPAPPGPQRVCATAVDLLGEVGSERALEPLRALKARFGAEPYIQFAADLAIQRIQRS